MTCAAEGASSAPRAASDLAPKTNNKSSRSFETSVVGSPMADASAQAGRPGERGADRDSPSPLAGGSLRTAARRQVRSLLAGQDLFGRFAYLVATQAVTVLLGFAYWTLAAHVVSSRSLGIATAAIFVATLLGAVGVLGTASLLLVQLGQIDEEEERRDLIRACLGAAVTVTVSLALVAWLVSPWLGPSFRRIGADPLDAMLFALGTGIQTAGVVLDAAAIGLRRGPLQLARNALSATLKLAFVPICVFSFARNPAGLLGGWDLSMLASLLVARRVLGRSSVRSGRGRLHAHVRMLRFHGGLALRHHYVNLAISSVGYFVPLVAALIAAPSEMAYFSIAQLVSVSALGLPYLLTTSLFVEASEGEERLRDNVRRTFPLGIACSLGVLLVLEPTSRWVLSVFGGEYADHGTILLRLMLPIGLPYVIKDHYVTIRRAQGRLTQAAWVAGTCAVAEVAGAAVGGALGGLQGLCIGWLACTVAEGLFFLPQVLSTIRGARKDGASLRQENAFAD
ncbi:MAG: polysaccharide biosynthesis protein [Acidimicrobiaceae bacterium]|nr:polysaccharide biosynthesis protein [Acidimicrobiaceae bacterium]